MSCMSLSIRLRLYFTYLILGGISLGDNGIDMDICSVR